MVKIINRPKLSNGSSTFYAVIGGLAVTSIILFSLSGGVGVPDFSSLENLQGSSYSGALVSHAENGIALKSWRKKLREACENAKSESDVLAIEKINKLGFEYPSNPVAQPRNDNAVIRCKHVVMDFGANIGDTSGHVIDSGMIPCDRTKDLKAKTSFVHFDVKTKRFENAANRNPLTHNLVNLMTKFGALTGPEDYCYYGVEGNPVFTQRLQAIEDFVMSMRPRPIQHMHFFTESVGAGEDGMTKLYLDTVNTDQNFWGSSIFKDHQDVRKSAEEAGKSADTIAADVMGYTIGTLMRKTLIAFDPAASPEEKKGNHLVLKVDIEGGEYPLLHQAVEEGTLCEFTKMGNTADLFIEFHSARVTGKHDYVGKTKQMKEALEKCGVTFRNLAAWWA
ncbi:hypothetical protein FisN_16Hh034 [Fistulifera solaris]|uniref:Methyltransferase FkbM domain-containing protein n=1 Tax=Fistulifera solaris TaxID=1519565 RepID=A0A1Z5KGE7_FISSO|nr:hypothetical protein FisN_16Hh034 [Fistulifera solaris]|eukprot:GAX25195.1 hypothetical protein FisN_16Hh034 [Fistulifera solaris]